MERIFSLSKKETIINYLKEKKVNKVMFKCGVWNKSNLVEIDKIYDNGYGIDLSYDVENDTYYASTPARSDMW